MASNYTDQDLEILISTTNRNTLDFLIPMFPFGHFSEFSILIINQTSKDKIMVSDFPSVRIINSFEKGLSKSRNIAIQNASKKIGLFADDDVIYAKDFDKQIIDAFNAFDSSVITFNHQRIGLDHPQNAATMHYSHNFKSIWNVCSIEIAVKTEDIKNAKISFNEQFGLGSYFETAEELLFMRTVLQHKIKAGYFPVVVVSHALLSSGEAQGSDKLIFARAALSYKLYGMLAYFWLPKYLFFLYRHQFISKSEILKKMKAGILGIKKYKELHKTTIK
ncbi:hypothetical protein FNO01nite_29880 [Flavobacterium noncentrifugens]|uniref:Glycosyl transferase family 2 n=1 Tax=Flavobacterium noncentrifugens TaxID=1128970 RepID=A0A1G9BPA1_9FLAO|nr:glycosyltransferase [Flavobacterium noncentrifugens]GEP52316.1 hypothetical protein FNO01nite_29880 [Flavobacterium noncentrifugens]SDK41090.1 Glycosyl transferase family 2 [Flavobacterium noncentrifugens]